MVRPLDGICGKDDIGAILDQIQENCPIPWSKSKKLWKLRRTLGMCENNCSTEILLERSVALLAQNGHMNDWYNQCPVASGICGPENYKGMCIDLVRWEPEKQRWCFIELKWNSKNPIAAVRQILRYGAIYLYCRRHNDKLNFVDDKLMSATNIVLQVVAPEKYYTDHHGLHRKVPDSLKQARESIHLINNEPEMKGLAISLDVLSLPEWFYQLPFENYEAVKQACGKELTGDGKSVIRVFNELSPAFPEQEGKER